MDLLSGLAGLNAAVELTRALRDAAKAGTIKPDEFVGRVGEIYDYIIDSKDALVDAKDQIQELRTEIKKLKAAIDEENTFQVMHGVYWRTYSVTIADEEHEAIYGSPRQELRWDGPFCPTCKDADNKYVRMRDAGNFKKDGRFYCDIHKIEFFVPRMS